MEAKFRKGDKVLDKDGKQWFIRYFDKINDNYYYLLDGKAGEVIESDLCLALPPEDYISEKVNETNILDEAKEIVDGLRGDDYYDPVKNFRDISVMASLMTGKTITPNDCIKVLISVKLTRESFKHKRDNLVDLCGYTYILDKIEES